ncbi:hypothetical protein AgCh_019527 [Apium graveolens]
MDQDKYNEEQNSEGVSKKRTRGPTLCTKLKRRMVNQNLECSISFDEYGDPIGDMLKDFRSNIGSVARVQVDINIESWDQVDQGLKDAMWDDIKEISEKAKLSQQHNEHVHYLGPSGYAVRRTNWCVDDPIAYLTDYESTNSSTLSSELTGRSYYWIRAHTKPQEGGGYYFPNDKTKEVFDKMKEHGGRVRGVGGGAKIKDVFGSGKTKHSGLVSMDELATITHEITKKVHKEFEEKMNEMTNSKLEVDDVVAEYQLTPLLVPCDEHETVGNAAGSFVQWPKDLVTLGQEPILLEKKKSETVLKKNVQGLLYDLLWADLDGDAEGWGKNDEGVTIFGAAIVKEFLLKHD